MEKNEPINHMSKEPNTNLIEEQKKHYFSINKFQ